MKSILASLKPYYYYLVGEGIKKIEVRKTIPKATDWNRQVWFYMSKDEKSFAKIPKEYQEKYRKHFGKVGLKFVCDKINDISVAVRNCNEDYNHIYHNDKCKGSCLTWKELQDYGKGKPLYGWHISDLNVYDEPKELFDFTNYDKYQVCKERNCFSDNCWICDNNALLVRPMQSWGYVESLGE